PSQATYVAPVAVALRGDVDVEALERALREVLRRHEVTRMRVEVIDGRPTQKSIPENAFGLRLIECTSGWESVVEREISEPFDLARGPLFRATLIGRGARDHVLVVAMHHIVCDARSIEILSDELSTLYGAYRAGAESPLGDVALQYRDYAHWQQSTPSGRLEAELSYWRGALSGGATPFMTMLGAWSVCLAANASCAQVVVGTPLSNRNRVELEGLVGLVTNTLALKLDLRGDPSFFDLLGRVREVCLGAFSHE